MKKAWKLAITLVIAALVVSLTAGALAAPGEEPVGDPYPDAVVAIQTEDESRVKMTAEDGTVYSLYNGLVDGVWTENIKIKGYVESHFASTLVLKDGPQIASYDENGMIISGRPAYAITDYSVKPGEGGKVLLTPAETEYSFSEHGGVYYIGGGADGSVGSAEDIEFGWCDVFYGVINSVGELDGLYIVKDARATPTTDAATGEDLYALQQKFDFYESPTPEKLNYFLFDPTETDDTSSEKPLFIWLHGFSCGMTPYSVFNITNYPQLWASDGYQAQFDNGGAYVMVPRAREDRGNYWSRAQVDNLIGAIKEVLAANPDIDADKVYIGGFSMGGMMTWYTIIDEPDMFAAAFPACPAYAPSEEELYSIGAMPIWLLHGYYDETCNYMDMSYDAGQFLETVARKAGIDSRSSAFKYITTPTGDYLGFNHCSWYPVHYNMKYADGSFYGIYYDGNDYKGVVKGVGGEYAGTLTGWLKGKSLETRRVDGKVVSALNKVEDGKTVVAVQTEDAARVKMTAADGTVYSLYSGLVNGVWTETIKIKGYVESHFASTLVLKDGPYYVTYDDSGMIVSGEPAYSTTDYAVKPGTAGTVLLTPGEKEYKFAEGAGVYYIGGGADGTVGNIDAIAFGWCDLYYAVTNDAGEITGLYIVKDAYATPINDGTTGDNLYELQREFDFYESANPNQLNYFLFDPTEVDNTSAKKPLFIWLHGFSCGITPYSVFTQTNYPQLWASDKYQDKFAAGAAYVMVPRAREDLGKTWSREQVPYLLDAINEAVKANPDVDVNRIYIGGFSMGGLMTWYTVIEEPDIFAAAFPACPAYSPTNAELESIGELPIWLFHGYYDETVNYEKVSGPVTDYILNKLADKNTDSRVSVFKKITDGTGMYLGFNHCSWLPIQYDLTYKNGDYYGLYYKDEDMKGVMEKVGGRYSGTLTEWLNKQTLANRIDANGKVNSKHIKDSTVDPSPNTGDDYSVLIIAIVAFAVTAVTLTLIIVRRRRAHG